MQACRERGGQQADFGCSTGAVSVALLCTDLKQHTLGGSLFLYDQYSAGFKNCFCTSTLYLLHLFISTAAELVARAQLLSCPQSVRALTAGWDMIL